MLIGKSAISMEAKKNPERKQNLIGKPWLKESFDDCNLRMKGLARLHSVAKIQLWSESPFHLRRWDTEATPLSHRSLQLTR